ncbi:MAG: UTP--glucose-1-phosphate uridylyltransferase GalU [Acidobacteria bacterium]|nr:UTP--glucose-1-phosphate uridylyltransferase GalU [Acidobacteriota bacterium]MBV9477238.1 UTP--glucose-1-phosphate uridylyltransferase GalU [Acidobacteriota bacterium]
MTDTLRTCVFPCAGFGTRFFPATKVIPKEMLPLVDKPILQYGIEEARDSGMNKLVIVTSKGKDTILDHFDRTAELERSLRERNKHDLLAEVDLVSRMVDLISVRQKEALGLGHAVLTARDAVGNHPFAVVLPDDVILAEEPCLLQMRRVFEETGRPVIALMEVSAEETSRYGIVAGELESGRRFKVTDMVEKPKANAPSRYAIIGRYILPPEVFPLIEQTERGAGGEIQLTDALRALVQQGDFYGYVFEGTRYDAGEKLGYLKATVDYALRHPQLAREFRAYLESVAAPPAVTAPESETVAAS